MILRIEIAGEALVLLREIKEIVMATQAEVDALTARATALGDKLDKVAQEVEALKAANPSIDTSALDAALTADESKGQALDDLNEDAVETPPAG